MPASCRHALNGNAVPYCSWWLGEAVATPPDIIADKNRILIGCQKRATTFWYLSDCERWRELTSPVSRTAEAGLMQTCESKRAGFWITLSQ
jgi:hypothetical protein